MYQKISWKDLKGSDLLVLEPEEALYGELVTLERDRQAIAGYLRNSLGQAIYKAEPEVKGFSFYDWLKDYEIESQAHGWGAEAYRAIETELNKKGITIAAAEAAINAALLSVPVYEPGAEVDFTGYLESLDEGRRSND